MSVDMNVLDIDGMHPVLLANGDDLVLVDTCVPGKTEQILRAIRDAGHDPANLTHLILTHQDIDHIGCAKDLKARHPALRVLAHQAEAPYIEGAVTAIKMARLSADHEIRRAYEKRTLAVDRLLMDGDALPLCGGMLVIHTPGHTPGHICLFIEDNNALIAGDALNLAHGQLAGPNPQYTQNMEQAKKSLSKLRDLDVRVVAPFHGGLFTGDVRAGIEAVIAG